MTHETCEGSCDYFTNDRVSIRHGDCIEVMRSLPDNSVDSVVTDPPYELGFMGKGWDNTGIAYDPQVWQQALRVLKPGGMLVAFGGTRTWHRLAVGIEDAGFDVRDSIAWMYGSGFPKSLDVGKAIDKRAGVEREVIGAHPNPAGLRGSTFPLGQTATITAPATPEAQQWAGFGTALKPAHEPIVVARKPLSEKTVAENVLTWRTGALNIDGSRIGTQEMFKTTSNGEVISGNDSMTGANYKRVPNGTAKGRWPANVILDESQAAELDRQSGNIKGQIGMSKTKGGHRFMAGDLETVQQFDHGTTDSGGASRFFYVAKANKRERPRDGDTAHPTVKPLALMRYLCKLVTPTGGTILEPFAGSGTTVEAALLEGFNVIGIEMTEEYLPLITQRIKRYDEGMF